MLDHFGMSIAISGFLLVAFGFTLLSKSNPLNKLIVCLCLITSTAVIYRSTNSFYGKPKILTQNIKRTWVIGFHAVPKKDILFLWLRKPGKTVPISHRVPYTKKVHKMLSKLRKKYRGKPFMISMKGGTSLTSPFHMGDSPTIMEIPPTLPRKR
jgi:hypothetical protein